MVSASMTTPMHLCLYDFYLEVPLKTVEKREASFFFHCGATSTPMKRKSFFISVTIANSKDQKTKSLVTQFHHINRKN